MMVLVFAAALAATAPEDWSSHIVTKGWPRLAESSDGAIILFGKPGWRPAGSPRPRLWVRYEYATPQDEDVMTSARLPLHHLSKVTLEEVDCSTRAARPLQMRYYPFNNLGGEEVRRLYANADWSQSAPGTFGEQTVRAACEPTPSTARAPAPP